MLSVCEEEDLSLTSTRPRRRPQEEEGEHEEEEDYQRRFQPQCQQRKPPSIKLLVGMATILFLSIVLSLQQHSLSASRTRRSDGLEHSSVLSSSMSSTSTNVGSGPRRRRLQSASVNNNIPLFVKSDFTVMGPSVFPKPSAMAGVDALPYLKPTYGQHRPHQDAVLVFAAEYGFNTYVCFVESLRRTGFQGDIVFAVSKLDLNQRNVPQFFETTPGLVVYVLELSCFNAEMEATDSSKGGMRVCQLHHLYAHGQTGQALPDPREARTIATTRYELYWLWALHYQPHQWIMLLDARDSYFQSNPFANVPRQQPSPTTTTNITSGILHFFGENADATRIGKSPKNRKWLTNAYGDTVVAALENKPTICSGSTMGEQVAIETYLRAMVSESDDTGTKLMGADQGFHNYLYYSNKLASASTIDSITVFDQGRGTINNLGAMRTAPLESWGHVVEIHNAQNTSMTVLNWDGTPSPVVHQFDRHKLLSVFVYKIKTEEFRKAYYERIEQEQKK